MKQNINVLFKNVKTVVSSDWKIQGLLLNTQIICRMSIEILNSTTQLENVMY